MLLLWCIKPYAQSISNGQTQITYVNPASMKACLGDDTLAITVQNISPQPLDPGSQLNIQFPAGVNVVGIVSPDYTFTSYSPGSNTYSYTNSLAQPAGTQVKIKLVLQASCSVFDLLDNTSGSSLDVTADLGLDYAIAGSAFNLTGTTLSFNIAQANIKTTVSAFNLTINLPNDYDSFNQEVRYDIAGNSSLTDFAVYFDLPSALAFNQIDSIKVNGVNVTGYSNPVLLSGSTYSTNLNAAALGLSGFSTGDVILVYFNYSPECLSSVQINYYAGIDCYGSPCYFENDLGFVNLYQAPPLINLNVSNNSQADYCGNTSAFEIMLVNEDLSGYTMYNPQLTMVLYNLNSYSNFAVNGAPVILGLPSSTTGTLNLPLNALQTSSGYVLNDYNGDGVYGEIAPGDTILITFDVLLDTAILENCPANITTNQLYGYVTYKQSLCIASPTLFTPTFLIPYYNYNNTPPVINVTGAVADGQTQVLEFCIDRYIAESAYGGTSQLLLDDQILYGTEIILPCGMSLADPTTAVWEFASGATIPVTISSTPAGGSTVVEFLSTPGQIPITGNLLKGCLVLETSYVCDTCSSPAVIAFNGYGTFEDCSTVHHWACESVIFCTDCAPVVDCNAEGIINHTAFEVNRTSFGWTSSAMTTKVTQADVDLNPANYNTAGAYACDTIHVLLEGQICGGADDFTPYITFEKPTLITTALLDLVGAEITINSVTSPISINTSTDMSGYWAIAFQTQNGPYADGTTILLEATFVVAKPVISAAAFPYHQVSEFTGAFFTNTQWIGGASPATPGTDSFFDHYGEECLYPHQEFNFYKVLEYFYEPAFSLNCGVNAEILKLRIGYQGGTSGDEFPNEFRPFNIFVDSLVFELTNPSNIGNVFATGASISSIPLTVTQSGAFITIEPGSGNWPVYDKNSSLNFYALEILFEVNCGNTDPVTLFDNYVHYENFFYSDQACNEEDSVTNTIVHNFISPNLIFSFLNPVQDALTPTADFDFSVSNTSFFGTNYPYMLVTYDPLLVSVSVQTATYYTWSANQIYIELGTLGAYTTLNDIITVSPLNCDVEQVTEVIVESGYHCTGYPAVPGTFDVADYCPQQTDTLQLTILKSNLNVDLLTSFSPEEPVNHCDGKFSILLQVYNDEKANISDLALQFSSIPGLTLLGTSYYYPIPQGESYDPSLFNWTLVDPTDFTLIPAATGSALQTGYTFYNDGLDASSTLDGILANDGINLYNFYHVKLDFIVDCDFDVSEELVFVVNGVTNCNEPIAITTSTFIDFLPPADNLEISMTISPDFCDAVIGENNLSVQVHNADTVIYDSLFVELYCDTDNNGVFDPTIDIFIGQQELLISGSNVINPGQTATVGFSTGLTDCSGGVFIATIASAEGCYCNYNNVVDTVNCCDCPFTPGTSAVTYGITQVINYITYDHISYALTNFPSQISNLTNDPNDPSLYVFDLMNNTWVYPNTFNPPCLNFAFTTGLDSVIFYYTTDFIALPHLIQSKLEYPLVDQSGDTCEQSLPACANGQNKFSCPVCFVDEADISDCSDTSSYEFTEEYLALDNAVTGDMVTVYPNPFRNEIFIRSTEGIQHVQLVDARGRIVYTSQLSGATTFNINTETLSSGVYVVVVWFTDGAPYHMKILRE